MSESLSIDAMYKKAEELGLVVVLPNVRDIFLDLDQAQDQYVMEALLPLLEKAGFPLILKKVTRSLNGNKHVYLESPADLTPETQLLLQACLGSDRKREILGYLALKTGVGCYSAFFEKPLVDGATIL